LHLHPRHATAQQPSRSALEMSTAPEGDNSTQQFESVMQHRDSNVTTNVAAARRIDQPGEDLLSLQS